MWIYIQKKIEHWITRISPTYPTYCLLPPKRKPNVKTFTLFEPLNTYDYRYNCLLALHVHCHKNKHQPKIKKKIFFQMTKVFTKQLFPYRSPSKSYLLATVYPVSSQYWSAASCYPHPSQSITINFLCKIYIVISVTFI